MAEPAPRKSRTPLSTKLAYGFAGLGCLALLLVFVLPLIAALVLARGRPAPHRESRPSDPGITAVVFRPAEIPGPLSARW